MTAPPVTTETEKAPELTPMEQAFAKARAAIVETPPATETETPPAETPAEAPPAAPVETPPAAPAETPPAEAPPTEEAPPAEGETAPAEDSLVVELPARRPGEKPMALKVATEEEAERLRQLTRGYMRRDEHRRAMDVVNEERESLEMVQLHLETDPVGFLVEQVKPELLVDVVRHALSMPHIYNAVVPEIDAWEDENVRARRAAELARDRTEGRANAEQRMARYEEARKEGKAVRDTIEQLVPHDLDEDELTLTISDCLADVAAYARANPEVRRLRPEEVVDIVQRRLRHFGVTPEMARAALTSGQPVRRPTAASLTKAPAPGTPDQTAARTTGAKFKQASAERRAAAAVPGAGAGAQPARAEPPVRQGVKERLAWVRANILKL